MKRRFDFIEFIVGDLWRFPLRKLPAGKYHLLRLARIAVLSFREFHRDKCQLRASALTFYSLLSVVPIVAIAFGIARGFGLEKVFENQLLQNLQGQREVAEQIIAFARSLLENTRGGEIAGVGVVLLFWAVVRMLGNIESAFNEIWGVQQGRNLARKFSDYLSVMLICPVLLIVSGSATVFMASRADVLSQAHTIMGVLTPLIKVFLKLMPFLVLWGLLTFVYIFMPNIKVNFKSGMIAGVVAGTLFQLVQWGYVKLQILVAKYSAIYGSFAALPLFLIWLQISWLIVLFGAELAFAHQNVETFEFEPDCLKASHSFKKLLALVITHLCVKRFARGEKGPTAEEVAHKLEIPVRLVRELLHRLVEAGVLCEVGDEGEKEPIYQPARSIELLTIKFVIDALERAGSDRIPVAETQELSELRERLERFGELLERSDANIALKDI